MESESLNKLNKLRKAYYQKSTSDEDFLERINNILQKDEEKNYLQESPNYPFIFVFGLPRSGTTMMSQLLIKSFDLGYINNFMARFWLAPATGIKLSKIILGDKQETELESDFATTKNIYDLHEFGYFWRYWLNIHSTNDAIQIQNREAKTDWHQLQVVLANMQREFNKTMCMKNIFGAYHIPMLTKLLPQTVWVYIERDPLDVAISILNARKKFFKDLNLWWSTVPPEYPRLKGLNYIEQIAGQVYYLLKFYNEQLNKINSRHIFKVKYKDLCNDPSYYMQEFQDKMIQDFGFQLPGRKFPEKLKFNYYNINTKEEEKLRDALKNFNLI